MIIETFLLFSLLPLLGCCKLKQDASTYTHETLSKMHKVERFTTSQIDGSADQENFQPAQSSFVFKKTITGHMKGTNVDTFISLLDDLS